MLKITIVNGTNNLIESTGQFIKHFNFDLEVTVAGSLNEMRSIRPNLAVVHNRTPEKIDSSRIMQAMRNDTTLCTVPIISLSPELSEGTKDIEATLEFLWRSPVPFRSSNFYQTVDEVSLFLKENEQLLATRKKIEILLHDKSFEKALASIEELEKIYRNDFQISHLTAKAQFGLGQLKPALKSIRKATEIHPKSLGSRTLEAAICFKVGDQAEALRVLEHTERIAETHLNNLIHWGEVYLDEGNTESSKSAFRSALKIDPTIEKAKEGLVVCDLIEGNLKKVQTSIEDSSMNYDFARLCNLKGIALTNSGQYTAAERLYNNAMKFIENKSNEYKLWLNLGLCMKKSGALEQALTYFKRCQDQAPADFDRASIQIEHVEKILAEQKT